MAVKSGRKSILPLVEVLEILTFLASSHASVADILSCSDLQSSDVVEKDGEEKGKDVNSDATETPLMLFLKLLNTPLFLRSQLYIMLVMLLLEVVVLEGIDAGGLTWEWYRLLSRVIFDKGALFFTTVGNNASFQSNPNSVYQTEYLSYFKFVGRVVAKALFDGQLLDVHFTRSFYEHMLDVKVTYHDIEAVDPDYYKNLKWILENDMSNILGLTFSMDAD